MKRFFSLLTVIAVLFLLSCNEKQPKEDPVLEAIKTEYSVDAQGGVIKVDITTNLDITTTSNVAWIECMQTKTLEHKTVSINVQANSAYEPRTGSVTVKGGEKTLEITVRQDAAEKPADPDELTADKTEYHIGAEGGTVEVTVSTNVEVTATPDVLWVKSAGTKAAASSRTLLFDVEANQDIAARSCKVALAGGDKSLEITISQDGEEVALSAAESAYQLPAEGGDFTVKVTTNIDYTVACDADWISKVETKTSRTDVITFTAAPNLGDPREAQISFAYGDIVVSVSVSQAASPAAVVTVPDNIPCVTGLGVSFEYQFEGEVPAGAEVSFAGSGWTAEVVPAADGKSGTVKLQAPADATVADVEMTVSDALGVRYTKKLDINLIQQGARLESYAYHCFDSKTPFNHDHFVKMGEAGIHVCHSIHPEDFEKAAQDVKGADVKLVGYFEDYIYNFVNWGDEDYRSFIAQDQALIDRVNLFKSSDQLWGYALIDEPRDSLFVKLGMLKDRLHELDPDHPVYVNLWGDQMNDATLTDYIRDAHPDQVCFDHYAVTSGYADAYWYTRLESLYRMCTSTGLPWWGFAATADIGNTPPGVSPPPTPQSLRLYNYTLLAYGASNIMVFTWLHYPHGGPDWTIAPLMTDGTYSVIYDYVKEVWEETNNHMFIFRNSTFKGIRHSPKENNSEGVTKLKSANDPIMSDAVDWYEFRSGAMISLIENSGNEYLVIEGKTMGKDTKVSIGFKKDVWRVTREGWFEPLKWENGELDNEYYFQLEPGEPLIIKTK